MTTSLEQLRRYVGGLTVYLRNFGATVAEPTLDQYATGEVGFEFVAVLDDREAVRHVPWSTPRGHAMMTQP